MGVLLSSNDVYCTIIYVRKHSDIISVWVDEEKTLGVKTAYSSRLFRFINRE